MSRLETLREALALARIRPPGADDATDGRGVCEAGHCRALLAGYGRFSELGQRPRLHIYAMLNPTTVYFARRGAESICEYCCALWIFDSIGDGVSLPCYVGRCAARQRFAGCYLHLIPVDIWLMIVAFVVHAGKSVRYIKHDLHCYFEYNWGSSGSMKAFVFHTGICGLCE